MPALVGPRLPSPTISGVADLIFSSCCGAISGGHRPVDVDPIHENGLGKERKRRNKGGLPSFCLSFSKSRPFFAKEFQRKLWRFWGISRGYKGS